MLWIYYSLNMSQLKLDWIEIIETLLPIWTVIFYWFSVSNYWFQFTQILTESDLESRIKRNILGANWVKVTVNLIILTKFVVKVTFKKLFKMKMDIVTIPFIIL